MNLFELLRNWLSFFTRGLRLRLLDPESKNQSPASRIQRPGAQSWKFRFVCRPRLRHFRHWGNEILCMATSFVGGAGVVSGGEELWRNVVIAIVIDNGWGPWKSPATLARWGALKRSPCIELRPQKHSHIRKGFGSLRGVGGCEWVGRGASSWQFEKPVGPLCKCASWHPFSHFERFLFLFSLCSVVAACEGFSEGWRLFRVRGLDCCTNTHAHVQHTYARSFGPRKRKRKFCEKQQPRARGDAGWEFGWGAGKQEALSAGGRDGQGVAAGAGAKITAQQTSLMTKQRHRHRTEKPRRGAHPAGRSRNRHSGTRAVEMVNNLQL